MQCYVVLCSTMQYYAVLCSTIWYNIVRHISSPYTHVYACMCVHYTVLCITQHIVLYMNTECMCCSSRAPPPPRPCACMACMRPLAQWSCCCTIETSENACSQAPTSLAILRWQRVLFRLKSKRLTPKAEFCRSKTHSLRT